MTYRELTAGKQCAILLNQMNGHAELYDLDARDLSAPLRSWETGYATGLKVRSSAAFGGDTLFVSTEGIAVFSLDSGEKLWEAPGCLGNAHSVEWVERYGVLALAGSTDNIILFYHVDQPNEPFATLPLPDAHGVLWDEEGDCLWAAGLSTLLKIRFKDGVPEAVATYTMPEGLGGAHDLAAVYGDADRLWITCNRGMRVVQFVKSRGTFESEYPGADAITRGVFHKGIGNFEDGTLTWLHPDGCKKDSRYHSGATWLTDRICVCRGGLTRVLVSPAGRFYKLRVCNTDYQ